MSRRHRSSLSPSAIRPAVWRSRPYHRSTGPDWKTLGLSAAGVALVALLGVGAWEGIQLAKQARPHTAAASKAKAQGGLFARKAAPKVEHVVVRPPMKPGPAALQHRLDQIAHDFGETVGIAVADVRGGWATSVNGDRFFPQQSVSKTWVAMTVLQAVDAGALRLDSPVLMTDADKSVFNQPLGRSLKPEGFPTTVSNLLRHALVFSDNSANDTLIRVIGLDSVRHALTVNGLNGIRLGADERRLQSLISGLTWRPEYGEGRNFEQARAKLPKEDRRRALDAYLADPADGATPLGLVQGLTALEKGELLAPATKTVLFDTMAAARTGPARLKGGLESGWKIAHKTGTGQDFEGASIGINDIAILTAPDGHIYAVAVQIPKTLKPTPRRLEMMQAVTRAVIENWKSERPKLDKTQVKA